MLTLFHGGKLGPRIRGREDAKSEILGQGRKVRPRRGETVLCHRVPHTLKSSPPLLAGRMGTI